MFTIDRPLPNIAPHGTGIELTSERLIPGRIPEHVWLEHTARYYFAAQHASGRRIIDCSCGVGYGSYILGSAGALEVTGVDISTDAIDFARINYSTPNVNFMVADAESLDFGSRILDQFVSFETLEHLRDAHAFVSKVSKALRPDGVFYVSVPNRAALPSETDKFSHYHFREFYFNEFRALLHPFLKRLEFYYQLCPAPIRVWEDELRAGMRGRRLTALWRVLPGFVRHVTREVLLAVRRSVTPPVFEPSYYMPQKVCDGLDQRRPYTYIAICSDPIQ